MCERMLERFSNWRAIGSASPIGIGPEPMRIAKLALPPAPSAEWRRNGLSENWIPFTHRNISNRDLPPLKAWSVAKRMSTEIMVH
jgi:hypothetical protein